MDEAATAAFRNGGAKMPKATTPARLAESARPWLKLEGWTGATSTATATATATRTATATTTQTPTPTPTPGAGRIQVNRKSLNLKTPHGTSTSGTITITNKGTGPLTVNVSNPTHDPNPFTETGGGDGIVIPPGGHIDVIITYSPTKKGTTKGSVSITSDDPTHKKTIKVKLKGKAK